MPELISPNLHVVLIHYPLGLLILGTLIELFAFLWRRSSFRLAGRWMIGLGALSAVPAVFSGIYALRSVAQVDMTGGQTWAQTRAVSPVLGDPRVWHMLRMHVIYQSSATAAAVLAVVVWLGCSDRNRRRFHVPLLALLVAATGATIVGAWFGGESIYRHGVGVQVAREPVTRPVEAAPLPTRIEQLFPVVELHVLMAGTAVAIALAAIGLSFRQVAVMDGQGDASLPTPSGQFRRGPRPQVESVDLARSFNPDIQLDVRPRVPAARFWLLMFAVAGLTSLGGWFVLLRSADVLETAHGKYKLVPSLLWDQIKPEDGKKLTRQLAHAATGSLIVVLPLVLGALARWAPRQRVLLAALTFVLLAAVASQVWLGVLLLYDTTAGPVNHFNAAVAGQP